MYNLLKMSDLSVNEIYSLIDRAIALKNGAEPMKRNDIYVSNLFFENSTRTKISFNMAEESLNLRVINFDAETSSIKKGETLYDTCKTLAMIGINILVIRHGKNEYYEDLKNLNSIIVNGGDGSGEHPTQCLLDLMTIYESFEKIEGLKIVIVGDIKNSRVANSNKKALERLGAEVTLIAPEFWKNCDCKCGETLENIISDVDICMLLRIQHERHDTANEYVFNLDEYRKNYALTADKYLNMKKNSIIMHPAPVNRDVEIDSNLVESEKSKIFEQVKNGRYMRMAILEYLIEKNRI